MPEKTQQTEPAVDQGGRAADMQGDLPNPGIVQAIKGIYWRPWVLVVTLFYSVSGAFQWLVGFLPPEAKTWLEKYTPSLSGQQWIGIGIVLFVVITTFGAVSEVMRRDQAWRTELGSANRRIAKLTDKARRAKSNLEARRIEENMKLLLGSDAPASYLEVFCECFLVRVMAFEFGTRDIAIAAFGTTNDSVLSYCRRIRDFFVQEGVIEHLGDSFRLTDPGRDLVALLKEEPMRQHPASKAKASREEIQSRDDATTQRPTADYRDSYVLATQHLIDAVRGFRDSGKCTQEEYNAAIASTQYMIAGLQDVHAATWSRDFSSAPFMTMIPSSPQPQAFIGLLHQWLVRFQEGVQLDRVKPTFTYTPPQ